MIGMRPEMTTPLLPGKPMSGGHVTSTHQMLASIFRAFRTRSLLRSDKKS